MVELGRGFGRSDASRSAGEPCRGGAGRSAGPPVVPGRSERPAAGTAGGPGPPDLGQVVGGAGSAAAGRGGGGGEGTGPRRSAGLLQRALGPGLAPPAGPGGSGCGPAAGVGGGRGGGGPRAAQLQRPGPHAAGAGPGAPGPAAAICRLRGRRHRGPPDAVRRCQRSAVRSAVLPLLGTAAPRGGGRSAACPSSDDGRPVEGEWLGGGSVYQRAKPVTGRSAAGRLRGGVDRFYHRASGQPRDVSQPPRGSPHGRSAGGADQRIATPAGGRVVGPAVSADGDVCGAPRRVDHAAAAGPADRRGRRPFCGSSAAPETRSARPAAGGPAGGAAAAAVRFGQLRAGSGSGPGPPGPGRGRDRRAGRPRLPRRSTSPRHHRQLARSTPGDPAAGVAGLYRRDPAARHRPDDRPDPAAGPAVPAAGG